MFLVVGELGVPLEWLLCLFLDVGDLKAPLERFLYLFLDVGDLGELSAWLLGPDLYVVEPDLDHLGMQPEVFSSLLLDVGDLGSRLEWYLKVEPQFLVAVLLLQPDLDVVDRLRVELKGFPSLFLVEGKHLD